MKLLILIKNFITMTAKKASHDKGATKHENAKHEMLELLEQSEDVDICLIAKTYNNSESVELTERLDKHYLTNGTPFINAVFAGDKTLALELATEPNYKALQSLE